MYNSAIVHWLRAFECLKPVSVAWLGVFECLKSESLPWLVHVTYLWTDRQPFIVKDGKQEHALRCSSVYKA